MAVREGSWWSRAWGGVAVLAFALHLGAALYEAAVIAPLWSLAPPASVAAWVALATKPDSSVLFHPLVAVIVVATVMAWLSGIATRGSRRWWLTLALMAAGATAAVTVTMIIPCERALFGAAVASADQGAHVIALVGDWMRSSAIRLAALLVGFWSAYRAQLSGGSRFARVVGDAGFEPLEGDETSGGGRRDFSFGDEDEPEITLGEDANPRAAWRGSLPRRRRTAKK